MVIKGRSPTMRHVSRTHRVALDCFFFFFDNPKIESVDTKNQLVDILTNEWKHLLCLLNIMNFSMYSCNHFKSFLSEGRQHIVIGAMSKRGQEATSHDGSTTAKARPVNLVMRSQYKEETSSSSLGSRVSPGTDDERERIGQTPGNWEHGSSKSEVENSHVSRQEKGSPTRQEFGANPNKE